MKMYGFAGGWLACLLGVLSFPYIIDNIQLSVRNENQVRKQVNWFSEKIQVGGLSKPIFSSIKWSQF